MIINQVQSGGSRYAGLVSNDVTVNYVSNDGITIVLPSDKMTVGTKYYVNVYFQCNSGSTKQAFYLSGSIRKNSETACTWWTPQHNLSGSVDNINANISNGKVYWYIGFSSSSVNEAGFMSNYGELIELVCV